MTLSKYDTIVENGFRDLVQVNITVWVKLAQ